MKTNVSPKKPVLKLNKRTIAHMKHHEMNKVKVGWEQIDGEIEMNYGDYCTEENTTCSPYPTGDPLFPPLTFLRARCEN